MREDRHGRVHRADGDGQRRPADGFRVRSSRRFRQLVGEAIAELPAALAGPASEAGLVVLDVPPTDADLPPDDELVRFIPPEPGGRATLVLQRRPLEVRATSRAELAELLRAAVGGAVARSLGLPPPSDADD